MPSSLRSRPGLARALGPVAAASIAALVAVSCGSTASPDIATPGSVGFTPHGGGSDVPTTVPTGDPNATTTTTAAAGTTTTLGKPTLNEASAISTVGLDKVHFGMTVAEAEKAANSKLVATEPTKNPSCYLAKPEAGPDGVSFLISDGRVERVDITGGPIATRSGAKVGSTVADVKKLYGEQLQDAPRPDAQPGGALVFVPKDEADAKFRLVFLTDGATVQLYRAGRIPQVLAPTGCK